MVRRIKISCGRDEGMRMGKHKKKSEVSRFLKTLKSVTPKRKLSFEKILEGV